MPIGNITKEKLLLKIEELEFQVDHDVLTKLPNRRFLEKTITDLLKKNRRAEDAFAVLFVDLDKFKQINDIYGHEVGDAILIEFSNRIKKTIRSQDMFFRIGGDEFVLIMKSVSNKENIKTIAEKIVKESTREYLIDKNEMYLSCSIGISLFPEHANDYKKLLDYADLAMYEIKKNGKNSYMFFSEDINNSIKDEIELECDIKKAIKNKEFRVYYQPQYNTKTNSLIGFEALVRWEHPKRGILFPSEFIEFAETNNYIKDIDYLAMEEAIEQFSKWYKIGKCPGILSLNLSLKNLKSKEFVDVLLSLLERYNLEKDKIELEVTETQIMSDPEKSIEKLNILNSHGIKISIDDFGTGYSSLSHLKKLPLFKIKIDKSFVESIYGCEKDTLIIKAIIKLGRSLGMVLIAEGVETVKQKEFLSEHGCDHMQGYFYSKALSARDSYKLFA